MSITDRTADALEEWLDGRTDDTRYVDELWLTREATPWIVELTLPVV